MSTDTAVTTTTPATPTGGMRTGTAAERAESARQTYRESLAAEMPLTGERLGSMFDRGERWGRDRIKEVRDAATVPATVPDSGTAQVTTPFNVDPEPVTVPVAETAARQPAGARAVVWTAFLLGIVASVAANVAHAAPGVGPALAAAFAPVALLLAVECMTRPEWQRDGWAWQLARYGGTGLVALVAAVMSYRHMSDLLASYGEDPLNAAIGPLAVDGLMVVAGFALLAMTPANVTTTTGQRHGDQEANR